MLAASNAVATCPATTDGLGAKALSPKIRRATPATSIAATLAPDRPRHHSDSATLMTLPFRRR